MDFVALLVTEAKAGEWARTLDIQFRKLMSDEPFIGGDEPSKQCSDHEANDVPANTKVAMSVVQIYRMNKFRFCAGDLRLHKVQ